MGTVRIRPLYLEVVRENGYSPLSNPHTGRQTAKEAGGNGTHGSTTLGPSTVGETSPEKPWNKAGHDRAS